MRAWPHKHHGRGSGYPVISSNNKTISAELRYEQIYKTERRLDGWGPLALVRTTWRDFGLVGRREGPLPDLDLDDHGCCEFEALSCAFVSCILSNQSINSYVSSRFPALVRASLSEQKDYKSLVICKRCVVDCKEMT